MGENKYKGYVAGMYDKIYYDNIQNVDFLAMGISKSKLDNETYNKKGPKQMKVQCTFCKKKSNKKDWEVEREGHDMCISKTYYICPNCFTGDELPPTELEEGI